MYQIISTSFKEYLSISSLHGLKYLTERGRHLTERIFWLVCCTLSWCATGLVVMASWNAFQNNAISFVVETTYLDWNTDFPSLTVCDISSEKRKSREYANKHFLGPKVAKVADVLEEIAYFPANKYDIKESCYSQRPSNRVEHCPSGNLSALVEAIRMTCEEVFKDCYWGDQRFDCCKFFLILHTELGPCYSLNNIQTKNKKWLDTRSNRTTGPGKMKLEMMVPTVVYVLSNGDVPLYNTPLDHKITAKLGTITRKKIAINDVNNVPEVRYVSASQRRCRFHEENSLTTYPAYSYSACVVECRLRAQLHLCNCTTHFFPHFGVNTTCDLKGLVCIFDKWERLNTLQPHWSGETNLNCDCPSGCDELELDVVFSSSGTWSPRKNVSSVEIELGLLPTERYKRNVVRGPLDLVVSMGGATGLFVGASLLSFAEFLYYFTVRLCGTVRMR